MSLEKDTFESKWAEFRRKVLNWRNKSRNDQLNKVNSLRERSISMLQRRYGYTKEEATYQLDNHYPGAWLG